MAVTASLSLSVTGTHTNPMDLGAAVLPFSLSTSLALTNGTGANQADRVFTDQRTLAASASESLDLAAVLVDAYGATITFATIKAVIVKAATGNTNDVLVGRPATNGVLLVTAVSAQVPVKPGGVFAWFCGGTGLAVTPSTADLLTITNSGAGTGVTYDVIVIGTSA